MAWASKCDRCGKYFDFDLASDASGFVFVKQTIERDYDVCDYEYDLCPECIQSLDDWLDNGGNK